MFDQSAIEADVGIGDDNILFSVCEEENEMLFDNLETLKTKG